MLNVMTSPQQQFRAGVWMSVVACCVGFGDDDVTRATTLIHTPARNCCCGDVMTFNTLHAPASNTHAHHVGYAPFTRSRCDGRARSFEQRTQRSDAHKHLQRLHSAHATVGANPRHQYFDRMTSPPHLVTSQHIGIHGFTMAPERLRHSPKAKRGSIDFVV